MTLCQSYCSVPYRHDLNRRVFRETRDLYVAGAPLGVPEIILHLQPQPGLGTAPEGLGQADRHFRRDAAMPVHQLGQGLARDAKPLGRCRDGQAERFKTLIANDFAGVRWIVHLQRFFPFRRSVIINQIDVCGVLALELEYDPQVTRYGHRPLSFALAFQGMEPEAWQIHVSGFPAGVQKCEDLLKFSHLLRRNPAGVPSREQPL
jgi:hypothetical protein